MIHLLKPEKVAATDLCFQMRKTEQEVQKTRSILAQMRLRGEQQIARGKRQRSMPTTEPPEDHRKRKSPKAVSTGIQGRKNTKIDTKSRSNASGRD
ncbi:hypothetical protein DFQ28_006835 [Apophysomyces sp. BC1034]|nr:hypothetical protein DFQ29_002879 [Apophysomyces sp. BC1021]KAG0187119.1 hypothetical protein DFQ28_006835 [Apophysomyces sp. BC1034]